ncbi:MAG TPA: N-acetylmuramoyl-L-alanine amidase [Acidimicrobiales bacterium]|nr:N-acetylmuramoyl-L-alanine amidase [Acidimicrobiales bacterium]
MTMLALLVTVMVAGCGQADDPAATLMEFPPQGLPGSAPGSAGEQAPSSVPSDATLPAPTVPPASGENVNPGVLVTATGVVVPVVAEATDGIEVRTPCGSTTVLSHGTRVRDATIVLDAGHGGTEPGAVSPDGLAEKGVNLGVVGKAKEALEAAGVSVVLTRTADYNVDLQSRADIAKSLSPRAFVSVHHNAEPDGASAKPGTETYYQIGSSDSKRLSGLIYEEVVRALSDYQVAWVTDTDAGAKYRPGQHGDYYAVLRMPAPVTSVLAELAFVSNPDEARLIASADVQAIEGQAVARGIIRYLTSEDPGSGYTTPYPRVSPPPVPGPPPPPCVDPPLKP